jgi:hypothetical protein
MVAGSAGSPAVVCMGNSFVPRVCPSTQIVAELKMRRWRSSARSQMWGGLFRARQDAVGAECRCRLRCCSACRTADARGQRGRDSETRLPERRRTVASRLLAPTLAQHFCQQRGSRRNRQLHWAPIPNDSPPPPTLCAVSKTQSIRLRTDPQQGRARRAPVESGLKPANFLGNG